MTWSSQARRRHHRRDHASTAPDLWGFLQFKISRTIAWPGLRWTSALATAICCEALCEWQLSSFLKHCLLHVGYDATGEARALG